MGRDLVQEVLRLAAATPRDAPLRRAWLAGRLRQEVPDDILLAALTLWAAGSAAERQVPDEAAEAR